MPIRKGDEVKIMRASTAAKGREGKVSAVYRRKGIIHVERVTRDKVNGQSVPMPIQASNVVITKLVADAKEHRDRKALLERKRAGKDGKKNMEDMDA